ncbi:nitroreductase family protein [Phocaeicola barnesiae]
MKKMWLILTALVGMLTVASCQRTTGDVSSSDTEAVLQNILQRKSVRSYRSDMPVEKEKVENLLRAGMAAPSGKDKRPWEFIVVDERELLDSLAAHLPYAKMLASAPMAIVVCGDETKSDYWYLDCSAVAENILLAAEAQGLGAVWTATYPYRERMEVVSRFLHTPSQVKSLCVIPVGYPMGGQEPKDKWDESRIHYNKWK